MSDVFISYAREDAASIKKIAESLKLLGLEVWFDERIPSGSSFNEIIWQELEGAKAILVGWSAKSCRSTWVMSEAMVGQKNDKLVAFFLEPCTLIPPFNLTQAEDLADWQDDWTNHGWRKVVERIGTLVGRPSLVGQPGAPGLCEALADKSGLQLAVWARTYPDDPYASKIGPVWESRQRASFAADLAAARKQVDGLLKKRQTLVKTRFATLERDFEAWVALGPQARQNDRPDPEALAALLVGPLGKRHGPVIVDPDIAQLSASPGKPPTERSSEPQSPPPDAAPIGVASSTAEASPEATTPVASAAPRRTPIAQIAAMLALGAIVGGGVTFLGTRTNAPPKVADTSAADRDAARKAEAENEALRGKLAKSEREAKALADRLDAATTADASLTRQLNDSQASLKAAEAQISQGSGRDEAMRTLDAAKKAAESERDATQSQLEAVRRQVANLGGERDSLQVQLNEKTRAVQALQDQMDKAAADNEALRGRLADSETETKKLTERLATTTNANASLTRQLGESEASLKAAQAQISEGSSRDATIRSLDAAKKAAESERDATQSELEAARRQMTSLTGERDFLQVQLNDKSRALQGLQIQLEAAKTQQVAYPAATSSRQSAQPSTAVCYVSGTDPNGYGWIALRYAPSKSSKWSSTHLTEGMHLDVVSRSGDYWRVRVGGEEGYAASQFIHCD